MSIQKILKKAENFAALAEGVMEQTPQNEDYQAQRTRLSRFCEHLSKQLRLIVGEMGGEILVLRYRDFDPKMLKLLGQVRETLLTLSKSINEDKPYETADKLVHYVQDRSTGTVISNLDFIAKHHLKSTNVDFSTTSVLKHPELRSLDALIALATSLKKYMEENPLIVPPGSTLETFRPPRLQETVEEIPAFTANQEDKTNLAVPASKKQ